VNAITIALAGLLLLVIPTAVKAQFDYTNNPDGVSATITGYYGAGGSVTIPGSTNGLMVVSVGDAALEAVFDPPFGLSPSASITSIVVPDTVTYVGKDAFGFCNEMTNAALGAAVATIGDYAFVATRLPTVTIPASVTNIGVAPFEDCEDLLAISVAPGNPAFRSRNGVLFDSTGTNLMEFPGGAAGSYVVPATVSNLASYAFAFCHDLTNVCFTGNAPAADSTVFASSPNVKVYYLPGTTGWSAFAASTGLTPVPWTVNIPAASVTITPQTGQFGFTINGPANLTVAVEACTNLAAPAWTILQTVTLTNGTAPFTDPQWTNYPARFYGVGLP
jgi:hypothetical protein